MIHSCICSSQDYCNIFCRLELETRPDWENFHANSLVTRRANPLSHRVNNCLETFLYKAYCYFASIFSCVGCLFCPEQRVGLVDYPSTTAPETGTLTVTTKCVENAVESSPSLSVTCDSSGNWGNETPRCQCREGHTKENQNGIEICSGMYIYSFNCGTNFHQVIPSSCSYLL